MSLSMQRDKHKFLYQQVISMIGRMQEGNTLRTADRLAPLPGLSDKPAVSVAMLRQASTELERQNRLEARLKSGYFLIPANHKLGK